LRAVRRETPNSAPRGCDSESTPRGTKPPSKSERGLDWFTFFVADIQTGFGPFLSIYLTTQKWTQTDIGLVLSIGSMAGLLSQVPGGWIVDSVRSKRRIARLAVILIGASALLIAAWPVFAMIVTAKVLHAVASSILGTAIAAISLGLVGHAGLSLRLGRNARFAAIGNAFAAGVMGASGYFVSAQSVFYVTAALAIPAMLMLRRICEHEVDSVLAGGGVSREEMRSAWSITQILRARALLVLTGCILLFHLANAAMLPLVGSAITMRSSQWAPVVVAVCIIVPQFVVAMISPGIGQLAENWGRRPMLLMGFAALSVRGTLLAAADEPYIIVAVQMLDGISAAVLAVLVPLCLADITRGTGRFNFAQGIVGGAVGVGGTLSTIAAGYLADHLGTQMAFIGLAVIGLGGLLLLLLMMPETKPAAE
jgi:MFS family permease